MQLGVRVVVILKALALQPAQQPPLAGCKAALRSSLDRIANRRAIPRRVVEDMVAMLRTLKSKRAIRFVGQAPDALGLVISTEVLPRIDRRRAGQACRVYVIGSPAERIVGVPGVRIRKDRYPCAGPVRRDHPRERVAFTRWCARPEVIQTGPSRSLDPVLNRSRKIAHLIPVHTRL